jgi:hypothetical protein
MEMEKIVAKELISIYNILMMKKDNQKRKKKYQPPGVESKEIYEVNALACGKCPSASNISLGGGCLRGGRKFS